MSIEELWHISLPHAICSNKPNGDTMGFSGVYVIGTKGNHQDTPLECLQTEVILPTLSRNSTTWRTFLHIHRIKYWGFPGGPVVRNLHVHCREHGFVAGIELRSHKPDSQKKKKRERNLRIAVKYYRSVINNSGITVLMDSFPSKLNGGCSCCC